MIVGKVKLFQCTQASNFFRNLSIQLIVGKVNDFSVEKLDRIWGILFDNLRQRLKNDGGNDYKTLHAGKRKRQKMEELA